MGREVRMVSSTWVHPRYTNDTAPSVDLIGEYIPLLDGWDADVASDWDEGFRKWGAGLVASDSDHEKWAPKGAEHAGRYTEWAGPRPSPDDYMPEWRDEDCTHLMMYETTSEGTPISPAFATAEELARWLADTGASSFGDNTASYKQWLAMIGYGWSVSLVLDNGAMKSGVEFVASINEDA